MACNLDIMNPVINAQTVKMNEIIFILYKNHGMLNAHNSFYIHDYGIFVLFM